MVCPDGWSVLGDWCYGIESNPNWTSCDFDSIGDQVSGVEIQDEATNNFIKTLYVNIYINLLEIRSLKQSIMPLHFSFQLLCSTFL